MEWLKTGKREIFLNGPRLQRLAAHIVESYEHMGVKDLSLLCVLKGGFKFFSDLIEEMQRIIWARKTELCLTVEFIRVKSYTVIF